MCQVPHFAFAVVICGMQSPVQADDVSSKEIQTGLRALENHYTHYSRFIISFEEMKYSDSGRYRAGSTEPYLKLKMRQFRDFPRWYETGYQVVWDGTKGKWDWNVDGGEVAGEQVFDGSKLWMLGKEPIQAAVIHTAISDPIDAMCKQYGFAPFTSGWLACSGNKGLLTMLRESTLNVRHEADGSQLVLEGVSEWGKYTVWLDQKRGYAPLQVAVEKKRDDRANTFHASSNQRLDSMSLYLPKETHINGYHQVATVTNWEKRGSVYVATGYTETKRYDLDGGKSVTETTRGTISEINLSPNFTDKDFTLQRTIPEGTPVIVPNEPGVEHEWYDGQVMNTFDANAMRAAAEARMGRNRWLTRIGVGLAALALIATAVWFVRRRRATA